jgi:hypothetical protein
LENRRAENVLSGRVGTSGKGKGVQKGYRRVNMVQILYTYVCKWKMRPVITVPGMDGKGT